MPGFFKRNLLGSSLRGPILSDLAHHIQHRVLLDRLYRDMFPHSSSPGIEGVNKLELSLWIALKKRIHDPLEKMTHFIDRDKNV